MNLKFIDASKSVDPIQVGKNLKDIRLAFGWYIYQVSFMTGRKVTEVMLNHYEAGRGVPANKLKILCDLYKVNPEDVENKKVKLIITFE